ncbi:unnamed protein product [Clonostachys chloroleuca]|uniref:Aminopeptidase n=1 Tax=Clonostachys chloroleuca TaxID=1926264 RepID=A0AA35MDI1_9HYPO|nr:unnamed protein product [Clonostachys chloroleuca]
MESRNAGPGSGGQSGREALPTNVIPRHYEITLEPNFATFKYEGTVTIHLDVVRETASIALHKLDLEIHETSVETDEGVAIFSPGLEYTEADSVQTVKLGQQIPAGQKLNLTQRFTGVLNDKMAGFYRSSYKDENGNLKYIATTQMEPTDARRAFPCFDEPALKATFTVTLIADHDMICLSNMDPASQKDVDSQVTGGKRKAVVYNKTPLMSTYLVAFVIGHLKYYESTNFRVPVRVYCTPDQNVEHAIYSAELGARTLRFYEEQFDNPYPLPKMDMVAVPDFAAGAMENWGLNTFRVVDLLFDEKASSAATKQRVTEVVQHELAHQWFGNLVTMDFWDGLWLKEGFATWMSWYSANVFYPEWKVWHSYVVNDLQSALNLDSLRSSHPIEVPLKRASEINQIFDAISYQKGSSVLRMISVYLGEEVFLKGVTQYLKTHAYGNTQSIDLWRALSEASGEDIERLADIWTKKVGYPVITVTENGAEGKVHVKQNRFLRTGDAIPAEDEVLYPVTLSLLTKDGLQRNVVLNDREAEIPIPDTAFFKFNSGHSGIYRTLYTPERLLKLGQNVKAGLLGVEDRAGLIADASALTAAGYQDSPSLLSLLQSFESEEAYIPWKVITDSITSLRQAWVFEADNVNAALESLEQKLVARIADKIGWDITEKDDHTVQQFKALVFSKAAMSGYEPAKAAAFAMFKEFTQGNRVAVHPNMHSGVFTTVLKYGGEAEYDALIKEYQTAKQSSERNTVLRCLGYARKPDLIQRTLDFALSDEVKTQDIYMVITGLRSHRAGIEALWTWMKSTWDVMVKRLPSGKQLGNFVVISTSSLTKQHQLTEVEAFFADKNTDVFTLDLAQSLDVIKSKQKWVQRDGDNVIKWLTDNGLLKQSAL